MQNLGRILVLLWLGRSNSTNRPSKLNRKPRMKPSAGDRPFWPATQADRYDMTSKLTTAVTINTGSMPFMMTSPR